MLCDNYFETKDFQRLLTVEGPLVAGILVERSTNERRKVEGSLAKDAVNKNWKLINFLANLLLKVAARHGTLTEESFVS